MPVRSKTWGWIRYWAFFVIFTSLLAIFWTYSYESVSNLGGFQTRIYPYRNFTIWFVLVLALFFCISVYAGIREHGANIETSDSRDKKTPTSIWGRSTVVNFSNSITQENWYWSRSRLILIVMRQLIFLLREKLVSQSSM
jgi:hypothetical protein